MIDLFKKTVKTEAELREILGYPSELVKNKVVNIIDNHIKDFVAKSPLIFISTSNNAGKCDLSPRGDSQGFVEIVNEKYLIIPERIGNKKCDSLLNIISNSQIGIIFIIPGLNETLRINGKAIITKDEDLLRKHAVNGKCPNLGIVVEVEECFIHCAKAFMRSTIWNHNTWLANDELPNASKILKDHVNMELFSESKIAELLNESYTQRLY